MTENTSPGPDPVEELVDAYIRYLEGSSPRPNLTGVNPTAAAEAADLFKLLDATWGSYVDLPPLEADPVAIALGLVPSPAPKATTISGARLAAARQRKHLKASDVAKRLSDSGHTMNAKAVADLEGRAVTEVDGTFLTVLVSVLGCGVDDIAIGDQTEMEAFVAWLHSPDFDAQVALWAHDVGYEGPDLTARARSRLLTVRQRSGGDHEREHWIAWLRTVLDDLR
jgi:hypothetical protein